MEQINKDHSKDQPVEEAVREWVYQHLNNGGFGLSPRDAHKLLLSLFNNLNISMKGATVGEGQEDGDDIYESIYMDVVQLVEKDNIQCEAYKVTAEKLKEKYTIIPKTKREKE